MYFSNLNYSLTFVGWLVVGFRCFLLLVVVFIFLLRE